jgi:DNA polymerase-1
MKIPEIWLVDFEFTAPDGNTPRPICMVARRFSTGETKRVWLWDDPPKQCPIPLGSEVIYVAYLASAEFSCHLALGWELPTHTLDLFVEFRHVTNGLNTPGGRGLLGALSWYGLGGISGTEKKEMRELAMRGGPYTEKEREDLVDYCQTDVDAMVELLPKMWPKIDLPRALIRGRYMATVARVERCGIPIDTATLERLKEGWDTVKDRLVVECDQHYGIYEGKVFKSSRWAAWCAKAGIRWPQLETGKLDLKRDTFREMARKHPQVQLMYELRTTLADLRLNDLVVGVDGRNRFMLGVFGAKTGRNTPSSAKSVFGPSRWIRHLIKPTEGMAVAYVDWSQQELGVAAKLSGDPAMQRMYSDEDPYVAFARMAGAVPPNATKKTHPTERAVFKICALAVLMGMGEEALGAATGAGEAMGRRLLRQHRDLFPKYWRWADDKVDRAMLGEDLVAVYGWKLRPGADGPTTYRNYSLQANGAEMLRLAAIAITERGIRLCALVHDAVLIEAPVDQIADAVVETQRCMAAASRAVLGGFELGTDAEIVRWPDRFSDERGVEMWEKVMGLLSETDLRQIEAPPASN